MREQKPPNPSSRSFIPGRCNPGLGRKVVDWIEHRFAEGLLCTEDWKDRTSSISIRKVGWGGWTRTNTVLINSEVSYQLDHAPAVP